MANDTIASAASLILTQPLPSGTNVDFLNDTAPSGTLAVAPAAFEITTGTVNGTLAVTNVTLGGAIDNFVPGDMIDLQNIDMLYAALDVAANATAENTKFNNATTFATESGVRYFIAPDGSVSISINSPTKPDANAVVELNQIVSGLFGTGAAGATLTVDPMFETINGTQTVDLLISANLAINACFAAGTHILTAGGEVPVEALAVGDQVVNVQGEEKTIIWIGCRDMDIARHPRPDAVRPIIIEPNALADLVPLDRLVVSPDHALYLEGVLVQARDLLNGVTIRPDMTATHVRYYHVELARHDIIFAEGAPVESFLDTGHRGLFDNAAAPLLLHPELMQQRREGEGCAPLCTGGEALAAIRETLARRRNNQARVSGGECRQNAW